MSWPSQMSHAFRAERIMFSRPTQAPTDAVPRPIAITLCRSVVAYATEKAIPDAKYHIKGMA